MKPSRKKYISESFVAKRERLIFACKNIRKYPDRQKYRSSKGAEKREEKGDKNCVIIFPPLPHRACHACISEFPVQFFSFSSLKTVSFLCTHGMCYTLTFQATRFFSRHRRCENKCRYCAKIAVNTHMRRTQWGENKKR